jgi:hypothetical protein
MARRLIFDVFEEGNVLEIIRTSTTHDRVANALSGEITCDQVLRLEALRERTAGDSAREHMSGMREACGKDGETMKRTRAACSPVPGATVRRKTCTNS